MLRGLEALEKGLAHDFSSMSLQHLRPAKSLTTIAWCGIPVAGSAFIGGCQHSVATLAFATGTHSSLVTGSVIKGKAEGVFAERQTALAVQVAVALHRLATQSYPPAGLSLRPTARLGHPGSNRNLASSACSEFSSCAGLLKAPAPAPPRHVDVVLNKDAQLEGLADSGASLWGLGFGPL